MILKPTQALRSSVKLRSKGERMATPLEDATPVTQHIEINRTSYAKKLAALIERYLVMGLSLQNAMRAAKADL
jgi:hypothetical protein